MKSVRECLLGTKTALESFGVSPARLEAEKLLSYLLGISRIDLFCDFDRPVTQSEEKKLSLLVERRGKGEPFAYIEGRAPFYNIELEVNRDVLIPRPETELLVEEMIALVAKRGALLDLCTGSGALALAMKKERPDLTITASDISEKALAVAKRNGANLGLSVEWVLGDLFNPFEGRKFEAIVANPPYLAESEWSLLDREVKEWEPKEALVGGESGLEFYERILREAPIFLQEGAFLAFEVGYSQSTVVQQLINESLFSIVKTKSDYQGFLRHFILTIAVPFERL